MNLIEPIIMFLIYVCVAAAIGYLIIYVLKTVMGWSIPDKVIQIAWVIFGLIVLLLLVRMLLPAMAHADDGTAIVTPPSFWLVFAEPITMLLGIAITAAFAWLTPKLAKLIGQEQANKLQESFQEAAKRAAGMAFLKLSPIGSAVFSTSDPTAKKVAVDDGVAYLKRTMPDTIKKLGAGDETLRQVVEANLGKLLAGK